MASSRGRTHVGDAAVTLFDRWKEQLIASGAEGCKRRQSVKWWLIS
jgi:hypothetical protein